MQQNWNTLVAFENVSGVVSMIDNHPDMAFYFATLFNRKVTMG